MMLCTFYAIQYLPAVTYPLYHQHFTRFCISAIWWNLNKLLRILYITRHFTCFYISALWRNLYKLLHILYITNTLHASVYLRHDAILTSCYVHFTPPTLCMLLCICYIMESLRGVTYPLHHTNDTSCIITWLTVVPQWPWVHFPPTGVRGVWPIMLGVSASVGGHGGLVSHPPPTITLHLKLLGPQEGQLFLVLIGQLVANLWTHIAIYYTLIHIIHPLNIYQWLCNLLYIDTLKYISMALSLWIWNQLTIPFWVLCSKQDMFVQNSQEIFHCN